MGKKKQRGMKSLKFRMKPGILLDIGDIKGIMNDYYGQLSANI